MRSVALCRVRETFIQFSSVSDALRRESALHANMHGRDCVGFQSYAVCKETDEGTSLGTFARLLGDGQRLLKRN